VSEEAHEVARAHLETSRGWLTGDREGETGRGGGGDGERC